MFKACGFSVAMGNENDEVKQAASYVTDDGDQDGLYNAFKYLKLIKKREIITISLFGYLIFLKV